MTPDQYCQQKAAASGSNFYYSFLFLPAAQRRAITALYAYCREVGDAVDEASDPGVARTRLNWWRGEVNALFHGTPQHPVTRALAPAVKAYALPESSMLEIIDGRQMDLDYNRYPDFPTLEVYCHRVAGVVGLLSTQILGYREPRTLEYAHTLGIALQLISIIRDVGEDARRNRVYIPLDELDRFGLCVDDVVALREDERFEKLMAFQIVRARSVYDRAMSLLPKQDRRAQRAGLVMAAIYRTLLEEIAILHGKTMNQRVSLTPVRKLWIAWKTWIAA
ncbi:MAG: presqualene diphosphate synthase HpnD [Betaproteobacteria bacterium]